MPGMKFFDLLQECHSVEQWIYGMRSADIGPNESVLLFWRRHLSDYLLQCRVKTIRAFVNRRKVVRCRRKDVSIDTIPLCISGCPVRHGAP